MPPSLHADGWRQGSVFQLDLSVISMTGSEADGVQPLTRQFGDWVVATQDCDLDRLAIDASIDAVEVRPVLFGKPGGGWGIRSKQCRLADDIYVDATMPRLMVSPRLLTDLAVATRRAPLEPGRATAFKTWLGRRYDRPAVPEDLVALAVAIAESVAAATTEELAAQTHDVLMQFDPGGARQFALFAVVIDGADVAAVEVWMANAALGVPAELGVLARPPVVVTKDRLSLRVLENSFAADLSAITWKGEEPTGAA